MHAGEAAEIAAVRDFWAAAPPPVRTEAGLAAGEVGGALCVAVEAIRDVVLLNRVVGLGLEGPVTDAHLDAIDAFYAAAGTRYGIQLAPEADPDLAGRLADRGFEPGYAWMKFERGSEPPPETRTDLRVEQVGAEDGEAFGRTFARGFEVPEFAAAWCAELPGRPDWHCFVAFDGEQPAACGLLYVAGEVGWLGFGATLAEQRGRGAQSALLSARVRAGSALGCRRYVTETGERLPDRPSSSYRNILRAGFAEAYLRPNLVSPPRP